MFQISGTATVNLFSKIFPIHRHVAFKIISTLIFGTTYKYYISFTGGVSAAENGGLQNLENLLDILDQKDNYNLADLEEIIELERAFDVIMQNLIKERDYLYFLTSYNISEMLDKFPFLQWDNFFEFIEAGNCKNLDHCTIKEILVQVSEFHKIKI